jgi:addiction module HigA family antidote
MPIHPGAVLRESFLKPLGLTPGRVARAIGVVSDSVLELSREETGLSAKMAVRLWPLFRQWTRVLGRAADATRSRGCGARIELGSAQDRATGLRDSGGRYSRKCAYQQAGTFGT